MRQQTTGATRNDEGEKFGMEGFIHPLVQILYGAYMQKNRHLEDGSLRAPDNWQKGLGRQWLMESGERHFWDWKLEHDGCKSREGLMNGLLGLRFNLDAYILDVALEKGYDKMTPDEIYNELFGQYPQQDKPRQD